MDLVQGLTVSGTDVAVSSGSDYAALKGSDAVVVTAGLPRKPGMSRDDLLMINAEIVKKVAEGIKNTALWFACVAVQSNLMSHGIVSWDSMCVLFMTDFLSVLDLVGCLVSRDMFSVSIS